MDSASRHQNVTGIWQGLFSYPAYYEPGSFTATLMQIGDFLSGTTHEPNVDGDGDAEAFHATVEGYRRDSQIYFVKTYDGASTRDHAVHYEGVLSSDGDEIEGTWRVEGDWDGRFLMIRSTRYEAVAARKAFVRA